MRAEVGRIFNTVPFSKLKMFFLRNFVCLFFSIFIFCSYTKLRDDPKVRWREEVVSEIIHQHAVSNDIDTIVTFDRGGVSGHKNHASVYNALALLCLEKR